MRWVHVMKRVLSILDLLDFDADVDTSESTLIEATDVNDCADIVIIALRDLALVVLLQGSTQRKAPGSFQAQSPSPLDSPTRIRCRVHICRRGLHNFRCVIGVWVQVRLLILHDSTPAIADEVFAVVAGEGLVMPLALQSVSCIVCTPTQRASTNFNCDPV